ncbi:MAG: cell division ATPase MinD, archaeal [Halonotius sp. J07HN4]|nr:MAG: cell division ATPase MinD, archaeal [Halonotius sp. J07HN4]
MAQVFAVASAKGGVGKTTTTANLGAILAETGADVVVIDGDISMPNLGTTLGIESPPTTLHDVLRGDATPSEVAYEGPGGVYVVPGDTALSSYASADPEELPSVLRTHSQADYVLIDVGAGVSHETGLPLSLADEVLLVSTPERDALRDTEKTRQLTDELGGTVTGAIITRTEPSTPVSELATGTLAAPVLASIPEDEAVRDAVAVGEPLSTYAPHSPAADAYRELVAELTGVEPTAPSGSETPSTTVDSDSEPAAATTDSKPANTAAESTTSVGSSTTAEPTTASSPTEPDAEPTDSQSDHAASGATDDPSVREDEAKWAEAATGTGDDVDDVVAEEAGSMPGTAGEPSTTATESSADEAAPTAIDDADTGSVESPSNTDEGATPEPTTETIAAESSEESTATPVADVADEIAEKSTPVGSDTTADADQPAPPDTADTEPAVDEKPSDAAVPFSGADDAADSPADPAGDDPLIPDAEGDSPPAADDDPTITTELGSLPEDSSLSDEPDDDDDDEEGFFRRLFFS